MAGGSKHSREDGEISDDDPLESTQERLHRQTAPNERNLRHEHNRSRHRWKNEAVDGTRLVKHEPVDRSMEQERESERASERRIFTADWLNSSRQEQFSEQGSRRPVRHGPLTEDSDSDASISGSEYHQGPRRAPKRRRTPDRARVLQNSRAGKPRDEKKFEKPAVFGVFPSQAKYRAWIDWKAIFDMMLAQAFCVEQHRKLAYLINSGGEEIKKILIVGNLLDQTVPDCYDKATSAIGDTFKSLWDPTVSFTVFRALRQEQRETSVEFVERLRTAARACSGVNEEIVKNQLLQGLRDKTFAHTAAVQGLSIKEIMVQANRIEVLSAAMAPSQYDPMQERPQVVAAMMQQPRMQRAGRPSYRPTGNSGIRGGRHGTSSRTDREKARDECPACGLNHRVKGLCPAVGRNCTGCGRVGHFVARCRDSQTNGKSVRSVTGRIDGNEENEYNYKVNDD